jgi:arginine decarboxylase
MNLLQTTSPLYPLMASLDVARMQIATKGKELLDKAIDLSEYVRTEVNKIPGLYCFGKEILGTPGSFALDPTKITINSSGLGLTGYEMEQTLAEEYHIQFEMCDLYNILAVGSFGDTKENHDKLLNALREISAKHYGTKPERREILDMPSIPELAITPRQAYTAKRKSQCL